MADGWARVTHTPGVCTATCGPGVTQLATALVTAARAQSPLVAFVGESPTTDEEYIQRFDQSRFAEACEAGFVRVLSPDTAVRRRAQGVLPGQARVASDHAQRADGHPAEDDGRRRGVRAVVDASCPRSAVHPNPDSARSAPPTSSPARSKPVIVVGRGAMWSGAGDAVLKLGGAHRRADRHHADGQELAVGEPTTTSASRASTALARRWSCSRKPTASSASAPA